MNSDKPPPTKVRSSLLSALLNASLVICVVLAVIIVLDQWSSADLEWTFELASSAGLLGASVGYLAFASFCWQQLLQQALGKPIGFLTCLQQTTMMLVGKYVPGKVWGVLLRGLMARRAGIPGGLIVTLSVAEMAIVVACGATVAGAAYLYEYAPALAALCCLLAPVAIGQAPRCLSMLPRAWMARLLPDRLNAQGAVDVLGQSGWTAVAALYLCNWLWLLAVVVCVASIGGIDLTPSQLVLAMGAYAAAVVAGFVAVFAPAGIGVREGVFVALVAGAIGVEDAAALSLMLRLWNTAFDVLAGVVGVAVGGIGALAASSDENGPTGEGPVHADC